MAQNFSPIHLGEQIRRIETRDFAWTESMHPSSLALKKHAHELANIAFLIRGSFTETIRGHSHECQPLSLLIKPPGEVHSDQYGRSGARCLIIEIRKEREMMIGQFSPVLKQAVHIPRGRMSVLAMQLYKEFHTDDTASRLAMEALTLELLTTVARNDSNDISLAEPLWLRAAKDFIEEQFTREISLLSIAESVGVNPSYLARVFRRRYRTTVGSYVRRLRLDRAARELTDFDTSLAEVALNAGFYDQSHFTNTFRRYFHITPSEFRLQLRKSNPGK